MKNKAKIKYEYTIGADNAVNPGVAPDIYMRLAVPLHGVIFILVLYSVSALLWPKSMNLNLNFCFCELSYFSYISFTIVPNLCEILNP